MKTTCLLVVLACTICFVRDVEGARILGLFPMQGKSHFIMFDAVLKILADAGHQVDVVSHFPRKTPYPNYTDIINLAGTLPDLNNNLTYDLMHELNRATMKDGVRACGTDVCNLLDLPEMQKLIKSPPTDPPYDLVITEFFLASCYFAFGRHLNVPVVALGSASVILHANEALGNPLNTAFISEVGDRSILQMNFLQRLKSTILTSFMHVMIRYYVTEQNAIVKKHFGPEMPSVEQLEGEISLLLVNAHFIFHGIRPTTPVIVEVAGLHVHDDQTPVPTELQKWLDDSKDGFMFFSLGSMVKVESFPKADLAAMYSAFRKVAPLRILMKVANAKELPPGLPNNVRTANWVPQIQVLKHKNIRGFITHGGLMGLQEAVVFGVPLVGIPLFADQIGNIQVCAEREIAVYLNYKNLNEDNIAGAITAVANDPKYKNNIKRISKLFMDRPIPAEESVVFWVDYILRNGEDTLRSLAVKLPWWQLALWDVYGTIIAAVLIVLYIVKLLLSTIIDRILRHTKATSPPSKKRN